MLALIRYKTLCGSAEYTGCFALAQNDSVFVQIYFHFVPLCNIQRPTQTNRKYDSAKLIHLTDDTSGFHVMINSFSL
jgi:hypothetical protein